ncbi:hypothetical protein C5167_043746 [Papaver somniferum]|uniref:Uncharacterized protein n=1 Tax=Papaver somniferum TaxID=3469 RepID=A0A4Y7L964_PAPSO|nr:hypothetical protein C5167_043746 [Papaver somniferum]
MDKRLSAGSNLGHKVGAKGCTATVSKYEGIVRNSIWKCFSLCFWRQSRIGKKKMMKRNKRRYRQLAHWIEFFYSLVITHCVPNSLMIEWRQTDNNRLVTVFHKSVVMLQNIQQLSLKRNLKESGAVLRSRDTDKA